MKSTRPVVDIRDLHTAFGGIVVHQGINLAIGSGETIALVGGSGSGKTTLLREIVGLHAPTRGEVLVFGESLFHGEAAIAKAVHRRIGMLFQHGALFSALSVFDNIAFPLRELRTLDESIIRDIVHLKLDMVELLPRHGRLMPAELSGGMVKRVALARALALEPELLVLDEPTAGLDPDRSETFVGLIRLLQRELHFTVLMVTHDIDTLAAMNSRLAVLADKRIVASGTMDEVMAVDHPFVRNFFCCERSVAAIERQVLEKS
jgi:phospholipid/cholesterol/gamma-HCH transport system ATP-binding protein